MKSYYQDDFCQIFHGDCRDVLPSLSKPNDCITDPPYGVGIHYGEHYDDSRKDYWEWFRGIVEMLTTESRVVVFTHRVAALHHLRGWDWVGPWVKPGAFGSRIGNSCVLPHWEPLFMYGIHHMGVHSNYRSDVFEYNPKKAGNRGRHIGREKWEKTKSRSHPCPKPVALYDDLIRTFSQDGALIVDPFMGSGTTLEATKALRRKAIGIEIEEKYCEIAARRCSQEVL